MNAVDFFLDNQTSVDKLCVLNPSCLLTYGTLKQKVDNFSSMLRLKCEPGSRVVLMSANHPFFIVSYLAVMKAGLVVVPLNPLLEEISVQTILSETGAQLMLLSTAVKKRLMLGGMEAWCESVIDEIPNCLALSSSHNTLPNDLAQIIYTSGSTSKPKGVMISHGNLIANTASILGYLPIKSSDRMMVVLPFYYCYGLSLMHTHIKVGAGLVLQNNFSMLAGFVSDMLKYECTGFAGVPSHFQILLRKSELFVQSSFPALRYVTQAGGKLHEVFIREFVQAFPNVNFYVMYGQTEATARLSYLEPSELEKHFGSIGKGIPGVELRVVNSNGEELGVNDVGEIVGKGQNIMLGYWNGSSDDSPIDDAGWLHTGDVGYKDVDGFVYLVSRKKEMVKVGGNRVSLKEVEAVVVELPDVVDCSLEIIPHEWLGEALKARVVLKSGAMISEDEIRKHCAARLIAYKVPVEFSLERELMIAPTGKKVV